MALLEIRGLRAAYGTAAVLHGVDLTVAAGEVVCLVGRNGVGKTSTLRAVVQDMITVTAGAVRVFGEGVVGWPPHRVVQLGVGYVPEDRRVFPGLSVLENLRVPARPTGQARPRWRIDDVLALFPPLARIRRRPAGVLSGGEQQMLSIGRALLTNPRLLLLDEPHEGLAPTVADAVIAAIGALKAEGVAMLVSEQSLRTIRACADRVVVLDNGVSVHTGTAAAFLADPALAATHMAVR